MARVLTEERALRVLVIDLDRLDRNIDRVAASAAVAPARRFRIVVKSLPAPGLVDYVARRAGTNAGMVFHRPFLEAMARLRPDADLLLGKRNPSGRLPITFPRNEGQLPLVYNHYPTGRGDDYVDLSGQPLFPFGYGLTYTRFDYSDLRSELEGWGFWFAIWCAVALLPLAIAAAPVVLWLSRAPVATAAARASRRRS